MNFTKIRETYAVPGVGHVDIQWTSSRPTAVWNDVESRQQTLYCPSDELPRAVEWLLERVHRHHRSITPPRVPSKVKGPKDNTWGARTGYSRRGLGPFGR